MYQPKMYQPKMYQPKMHQPKMHEPKMHHRRFCLWMALAVVGGLALPLTGRGRPDTEQVRVEMRNILYHFTDRIAVHIIRLQGSLVPTRAQSIPVFDDKESFAVALKSAEISISTDALANVLNDHVFASAEAPLKKLTIATRGNVLRIKGQLHSRDDIPFETEGTLTATAEGQIRVHVQKIKAAHLRVKGIMDLLGVKMADLVKANNVAGVRIEENDLVLDPSRILPPPRIQGRISAVRVQGNQIVQTFGGGSALGANEPGNYMSYRGAQLRFGKLTMSDTDLVLIDLDPRDPLDFYLDHYKDQLVAGYSKTTPQFGLRVFIPDFNKLRRSARAQRGPAPRR